MWLKGLHVADSCVRKGQYADDSIWFKVGSSKEKHLEPGYIHSVISVHVSILLDTRQFPMQFCCGAVYKIVACGRCIHNGPT